VILAAYADQGEKRPGRFCPSAMQNAAHSDQNARSAAASASAALLTRAHSD
jgi:hypothetical protein